MILDCVGHRVELLSRKSPASQQFSAPRDRVRDMIPAGESLRISGTVPDKDSQIVHPCAGKKNAVIVIHTLSYPGGKRVETRLVSELVGRLGLNPDVSNHRLPPANLSHAAGSGQLGEIRIKSRLPR